MKSIFTPEKKMARRKSALSTKFGLLAIAALLAVPSLQAATIIWSPATGILGDSDVSTDGTFKLALNLGSTTATTVNGVTFAAQPSGTQPSGTNPGTAGEGALTGSTAFGENDGAFGSANNPFASLSAGYKDLLDSAIFQSGATLTINNLVVNREYQVQFWSNDSRGFNRNTTLTTGANSVTLFDGPGAFNGAVGQYTIGTFTADQTTQDIAVGGTIGQLNGYQIRAVPEPSSMLLLAGSLTAVLILRRRR